MRRPIPCSAEDARTEQRDGAKGIEFDEEIEYGLCLTTADGEHPVGRDALHRLAIVIVHLELFLLIYCIQSLFADNNALIEHELAQGLAEVGVLADGLSDNVAGAFECGLDRGDFPFWIDERGWVIGDGLAGGAVGPGGGGGGGQAAG